MILEAIGSVSRSANPVGPILLGRLHFHHQVFSISRGK